VRLTWFLGSGSSAPRLRGLYGGALGVLALLAVGCASEPSDLRASAPLTSNPAPAAANATAESVAATLGAPEQATEAVIDQIIDGDTVVVDFGDSRENVRLIGIDTPEKEGGFRPAECYGEEATSFAAALIPEGTSVLVTRDVEARDVYDRLLGYVYRASDGLFINLALVETGHADKLNIAPNDTFAEFFAVASAQAKNEGLGLWGACGSPDVPLAD
jgi:micrococcal nuclease